MMDRKAYFESHIARIKFNYSALLPIQKLYWQIYADELPFGVDIGLKLHDDNPGFDGVVMKWFFANSESAMKIFRDVLDGSELSGARSMFGSSPRDVRVVQANIIEVRGSYPTGTWHSDFTDDAMKSGVCATLLTPLFTHLPHFGGLEVTEAKRGVSSAYDELSRVEPYVDGEGVLFDGSAMIHRTQSYQASPNERRLLMSWQLADVSPNFVPMLDRIAKRNGDPMFYSEH